MIPSALENQRKKGGERKKKKTDDTRFMLFNVPPKGMTRA